MASRGTEVLPVMATDKQSTKAARRSRLLKLAAKRLKKRPVSQQTSRHQSNSNPARFLDVEAAVNGIESADETQADTPGSLRDFVVPDEEAPDYVPASPSRTFHQTGAAQGVGADRGAPCTDPRDAAQPVGTTDQDTTQPAEAYQEFSITIVVGNQDINVDATKPKLNDWLKATCKAGFFGLERGGVQGNLHWQGVVRLAASHANVVTNSLRKALGWNEPGTPPTAKVQTTKLTQKKMHNFQGMDKRRADAAWNLITRPEHDTRKNVLAVYFDEEQPYHYFSDTEGLQVMHDTESEVFLNEFGRGNEQNV
ncbi:hypothetical protein WJX72_004415 [[Myrmecia] bisecta]|uniref:Replication associated protein n=1 Tax=[Myrmecia] bisecta TaxID=41462 RepID=A0AAW1QQB0_9CHLO